MSPIGYLTTKKKPHRFGYGKSYYGRLNFGHVQKKSPKKKLSEYASVIYQKKDNFNTNKKIAYEKSWKSSQKKLRGLKDSLVFSLFCNVCILWKVKSLFYSILNMIFFRFRRRKKNSERFFWYWYQCSVKICKHSNICLCLFTFVTLITLMVSKYFCSLGENFCFVFEHELQSFCFYLG